MSKEETQRPTRLIIADDDPILRLDLHRLLCEAGYDVLAEASDGATAVRLARRLSPDVVLLDVKMPKLDGIEAARILNVEKIAPVVLLTAYSHSDLVKQAVEAGVFSYLVKPFSEPSLIAALEVTRERWNLRQQRDRDHQRLTRELSRRELIDDAKKFLMRTRKLSEQEAFRLLQLQSMNTRRSMRAVSEAILLADQIAQSRFREDRKETDAPTTTSSP